MCAGDRRKSMTCIYRRGPGAADLPTLRGRDLIASCPVCLYAGSLIPEGSGELSGMLGWSIPPQWFE